MQTTVSPATSGKLANLGFLCACLVVTIHVPRLASAEGVAAWCHALLPNGLARVGVPFFFVAAGFFLAGHVGERGWWAREVGKRVRSLLVPYLIWPAAFLVLSFAITLAANAVAGAAWSRGFPQSVPAWCASLGWSLTEGPSLYTFWFVRTLMLFVLAAPLLAWPIRLGRWRGGLWVLLWWLVYGLSHPWPAEGPLEGGGVWPMAFPLSREGLAYFTLGLWLRRFPLRLRLPRGVAWGLLGGAMGLFALTHWAMLRECAWYAYPRWMGLPLALVALWRLIPATPWPRGLTGLAFPLYVTHPFITHPLVALTWGFPWAVWLGTTALGLAVGIAVTLASSLTLTAWARRRFPRLAAVVFGGR